MTAAASSVPAATLRLFDGFLRPARSRGSQHLLEIPGFQCARYPLAVGKEQGGCTVDMQLITELLQGIDGIASAALGGGQDLVAHPVAPRRRSILRAPD